MVSGAIWQIFHRHTHAGFFQIAPETIPHIWPDKLKGRMQTSLLHNMKFLFYFACVENTQLNLIWELSLA